MGEKRAWMSLLNAVVIVTMPMLNRRDKDHLSIFGISDEFDLLSNTHQLFHQQILRAYGDLKCFCHRKENSEISLESLVKEGIRTVCLDRSKREIRLGVASRVHRQNRDIQWTDEGADV